MLSKEIIVRATEKKPHTTDILYCCECDECQRVYADFNKWLEVAGVKE